MYLERSGSAGSARRPRLPVFGLARGSRSADAVASCAAAGSPSATRKRTETPGSAAVAARRTSSAKWPSIQARVNSFGTPTSSTSPSSASARVVENHAPKTIGERSSRMRSATAVQSRSGVEGVYGHSYARPRRRRVSIDAVRTGRGERMLARSDDARPLGGGSENPLVADTLEISTASSTGRVHARRGASPPPERDCAGCAAARRRLSTACPHTRPAARATATLPLSRPADTDELT